tara:strand:+ start:918 stop:1058 length:141 start_codon:yes stop_codon:yes gene_type:complete
MIDERLKTSAWMDFSWKVIQSVSDPVHRYSLNQDWNALAEKLKETK